ncbi:MAG: phosphotransferase [Nocardioidaceae bacterium]
MSQEQPLTGGTTEGVVRVGDTVRRPRTERSPAVEALLLHLEAVGAEVAPRFLGVDDRGRQVLEYVAGEVPSGPPFDLGDPRLTSAMRLVRRLHDATAGTALAGSHEVVCHGDLGPHNTVFRGEEAVRVVDWDDEVRGGRRIVDVAHAVWCYADLVEEAVPVGEQARRLELACEAYGGVTPAAVVEELLARFRRARAQAVADHRSRGARVFDGLVEWTEENRQALLGPGSCET